MFTFAKKILSRCVPRWLRYGINTAPLPSELESECPDEIKRLAQKTGLSASDLQTLAGLGIHGAEFLRRRMAILGVDPDEFSRSKLATFRELQKSCSSCKSHRQCAQDLAKDAVDPTRPDWRDYCPNATMLILLSTIESYDSE